MFPLLNPVHDIRGRALVAELIGHEFHVRIDVLEKQFVTGAKVVQSRLTVGG